MTRAPGWLLLLALLATSACAGLQTAIGHDDGHRALREERYDEALRLFEASETAEPGDGLAVFFQGVALNRLERFAEALARLQRANELRAAHPDLPLEMGWSLLALRRFKDASAMLERAERSRPGHGKTSELLGRAYLGLRDYSRAETRLKEALQADPTLAPSALYHLALVAQSRGYEAAARGYVQALWRVAPESSYAMALRPIPAVARTSVTAASTAPGATAPRGATAVPLAAVPPSPPAPRAPSAAPQARAVYISVPAANLRTGPGTGTGVITVLRKGTKLTVLEEKNHWLRVRLEGGTTVKEGWVAVSVTAAQP